jgi:hypothetical protein
MALLQRSIPAYGLSFAPCRILGQKVAKWKLALFSSSWQRTQLLGVTARSISVAARPVFPA